MSAKNTEATGTNWLQAMIDEIIDLQRKLEDSNTQIGNNQQVRQQYDEAMTKVKEARESINRLAAVFDKEHAFSI
jgi:uncharacterized coiled-coil DUF342 family protein